MNITKFIILRIKIRKRQAERREQQRLQKKLEEQKYYEEHKEEIDLQNQLILQERKAKD